MPSDVDDFIQRHLIEMDTVVCPYCLYRNNVPDECYEENTLHECECTQCEKIFGFYTTYTRTYGDECKLPCANGEPHSWKKICGAPEEYFVNKRRCEYCDITNTFTTDELKELNEKP